jgi:hypothetical protein
MSVKVLLDPYGLNNDDDALHVIGHDDHLSALRQITVAVANGDDLVIAVHNPGMFGWYDHLPSHGSVVVLPVDPAEELATALGVDCEALPSEIRQNPKAIVTEGLLPAAHTTPIRHGQDPLTWILQSTLGTVWVDATLTAPSQIAAVIRECLRRERLTDVHPAVLQLRDKRIAQWIQAGSPFADVVRWLFDGHPVKRAQSLVLLHLARNYPHSVQVEALSCDGRWADLSLLQNAAGAIEALPLDLCKGMNIPAGYSQAIRAFLKKSLSESGLAAVDALSGCLPVEVQSLRHYLGEHRGEINDAWLPVLQATLKRFADDPSFSSYVRRLLPRCSPRSLDENSDWTSVRNWLAQEYFPYYQWCVAVNRLEDTTQAVTDFELWLLKNYDEITRCSTYAPFAFRQALDVHSFSSSTLLVIVDALSWSHVAMLHGQLAKVGVMCDAPSLRICALPSETSVAKPSLVAGRTHRQLQLDTEGEMQYTQLLSESTGVPDERIVCGTSLKSNLIDLVQRPAALYLYLNNDVDQQIHKVATPETRYSLVERLLEELAQNLAAAAEAHLSIFGKKLAIVISSDHGYTELPRDVPTLSVPPESDIVASHPRCVCLRHDHPGHIEGLVSIRNEDIERVWVVAKGYACIGNRPRGATHGGLTPQEVVVPLLTSSSLEDTDYQDVEFGIVGDIRRGRKTNPVRLRIANPNEAALVVHEIDATRVAPVAALPITLPAGESLEFDGTVDGEKLDSQLADVTARVVVEFLGSRHTSVCRVSIATTGAAVTDQAFDAEFDV